MIARLSDYRRIRKLRKGPVLVSEEAFYLSEEEGGASVGLWSFIPAGDTLTIHADLGPECRGKKALESAREALSWVFGHTEHRSIYANIPNTRRHAQFMCIWSGFKCIGYSETMRFYKTTKKTQVGSVSNG